MDYDEHPYPCIAHAQTHPERMATLALLLGMPPPPVEHCRVLELGCASGFNLLPMAEQLPQSTFVGIDHSARQIRDGQAAIATLGLQNITLHCMDIRDVAPTFGQFDYIIAHGIYSWVPAPVQAHILSICQHNLAPGGIAYVSYNAYPGWHAMHMLRDAMRYHTRTTRDPHTASMQAYALLDFLSEAAPQANPAFGRFLTSHIAFLHEKLARFSPNDPTFLLYDELAEINEPLAFAQFIERAARHGLQYLAESDFPTMLPENFPPAVAEKLHTLADDVIALEQYMDFLRSRSFRETLLCAAGTPLQRTPDPEALSAMAVAAALQPVSAAPDMHSKRLETFRGVDNAGIATAHPISKAALMHLASIWPRALPFETLFHTARAHIVPDAPPVPVPHLATDQDAQVLRATLLKGFCCSTTLIRLHMVPPQPVTSISSHPAARPTARLQAQHSPLVTNLYHENVQLTTLQRHLVRASNGRRSHAALREVLDGVSATELATALQWLAAHALLVG